MSEDRTVRIGCAGWSIPRASADEFAEAGTHLVRYSRVLNCAEINSSFYRPHKPTTWEKWRESVPPGFRFAVKAPKAITHDAGLKGDPELLAGFLQQVGGLREKLGPILFQLPPSLEFEPRTGDGFFRDLRERFAGDVVCEPRHPSWFSSAASELFTEFRIARVAADPACTVAAAEPGGSSNVVYFRLHGSPRRYYSAYDDSYLEALAERLANSAATATAWCIFDNTASGAAARNALELARKLNVLGS